MSLTNKKVSLTLNKLEMAMLLNIMESFSWQGDEVFNHAKIDTGKKEKTLWKLQGRMQAIYRENFDEAYIIQKMMEGDLEFPHAQ